MFTDAVGQFMGSKTAVTHKDDLAIRKPPNGLEHTLSGPVCEFFVPQSTFTGIAFRRGEKRLKWQGLDACLPGQWSEKREGEPPQASGFDKMTATGAHRVTIDPASVNHWAPTAFYGVIKADDDWFLSTRFVTRCWRSLFDNSLGFHWARLRTWW